MSGKVGATYKSRRYRNYYCSRAMHSRELCAFYNGHSASKLERAVRDYLGRFSDPQLVMQYLAAADREEVTKREAQLRDVEKQLVDSEGDFLRRLDDLLRRNKVTEAEFDRANQSEREKNARTEASRVELKGWLETERDRKSLADRLPGIIGTFLEAFEGLDPRQGPPADDSEGGPRVPRWQHRPGIQRVTQPKAGVPGQPKGSQTTRSLNRAHCSKTDDMVLERRRHCPALSCGPGAS
jgi:hypothetical protein